MSTSALTPTQIDTALADLYREYGGHSQRIAAALDGAHRALGEHPDRRRGALRWATTHEQAETRLRALAAAGTGSTMTLRSAAQVIDALDTAREHTARVQVDIDPLEAEHARRGWYRFFLVQGGHIHSSMGCSTCYPTTQFGWLPELSGLSEADAVEAYGPLLCSVCFPFAPVEWTVGKPKPERCSGAGSAPRQGTKRRQGMRFYGECAACGERQTLNPTTLVVRAHKPPKS